MEPERFYHIYNRGNNRQNIFFNRSNYLFFLKKVRKHLCPYLEIVAYCLMPNHFHFLVYSNSNIISKDCSKDLRIMLSSYTRAINKQEKKTGSLFQQNTKIKGLTGESGSTTPSRATTNHPSHDAPFICFHYIHQNPIKAGLVENMEDWEMSSYCDYADKRDGTLCNKPLAHDLLEIPKDSSLFVKQSISVIIEDPALDL